MFKAGDKVTVEFYGQTKHGTVSRIGALVWVCFDGETKARWFHAQSVKPVEVTEVIFRRWRNGNIIALFPREPGTNSPYTCASYEHVGQHGAATPDSVILMTSPAKPAEYAELKRELESAPFNYNFRVIKRIAYGMIDERRKKIEGTK